MKRLLPVLLAAALLVPVSSAFAAKVDPCSGDKDVKSVSLGKEVVYVSADMKSASFTKDATHTLKHDLMYYSAQSNFSRRTPGTDKDGNALAPAFKHGDVWHILSRDENGNLIVDGAAAPETAVAPSADKKEEVKKPAKKAKKGKKAKKAKKAKKVEEKAAEPVAPAAGK
ncbi:MAG TPA: hypothetical protein PLU72_11705 [Candidatus Ozemobacteraceae bacterium]|nr:hypothetical protein [Candidatus Ozemobacteraceae bacterium]